MPGCLPFLLLKINKQKSEIIFNNNNVQFQTEKNEELQGYQCTYNGNVTFLGIHHGNNDYINDNTINTLEKVKKQIYHIEMIDDDQIKFILYRKCMNYTKIVYLMKNTQYLNEWFDITHTLYRYIVSCITKNINANKLMKYQLYLSQKSGGLGMQPIHEFHLASKITAISDKILLLNG